MSRLKTLLNKQRSAPQRIEILDRHINRNRRLTSDTLYVVTEEVHVKKNVKLTIDDGVTIFIENGLKSKSRLQRAALIFKKGSKLKAQRLCIKACGADHRPTKISNNGGIWFIGNYQSAEKDGVKTKASHKANLSSFKAKMITTYHLGHPDPQRKQPHSNNVDEYKDNEDDIDAVSVLGVGPAEWAIAEIRNYYSGDDGIDITNSHIRLDRLKIKGPFEDCINLSSSRLEVRHMLTLDVKKTNMKDRDLVDFETDNGCALLEIHANCKLDLNGVFGDEIILASKEMPKPTTRNNNEKNYHFQGSLKRAALIYSLDKD